jgi:hypothetical protein
MAQETLMENKAQDSGWLEKPIAIRHYEQALNEGWSLAEWTVEKLVGEGYTAQQILDYLKGNKR